MKLVLALLVATHLCALGMTTETVPEKVKDVPKVIEVPEIVKDVPKVIEVPEIVKDELEEDVSEIEENVPEMDETEEDEPLEFIDDETAAADEELEDEEETEGVENIEDEEKDDPGRGPFNDDRCKYSTFENGFRVRLNPSSSVVKHAFATTEFDTSDGSVAPVWDDAIIPMLGKVYKLHQVSADRVALVPPDGRNGYFYFPFTAFITGYKVGGRVRLHFDRNVVKNSFVGLKGFRWDDAFIPMLGKKFTITEIKGSMIGITSLDGRTFFVSIGALIKEECYKNCGLHGSLNDNRCICTSGWTGNLCQNRGKGSCKYLGFTAGAAVKLNPSASVVKNAFATTEFDTDNGKTAPVWDNAIIPMLGKVYKLHHVENDRVALVPPSGNRQNYFFFPFKAFVSEFQVGLQVRLNSDKNIVKNSFNNIKGYVWSDAIIPMLGKRYTVKGVKGAMLGIEAPHANTIYWFPIGALVPEHCYKNCKHGRLNEGKCICNSGWTGELCDQRSCSPSCRHGQCVNGNCRCNSGYGGRDCGTKLCSPSCEHGSCDNGVCKCSSGWGGAACNVRLCNPSCDNGRCDNGHCKCNAGWEGKSCNTRVCNPRCDHGVCNNGVCRCHSGWTGAACNQAVCNPACEHGTCVNGRCKCDSGWTGSHCNERVCDPTCVHGVCNGGVCRCQSGWTGAACNTKVCNPACVHGTCVNGRCKCDNGWTGSHCNEKVCNPRCGHGVCNSGVCNCHSGWTGATCNTKMCNPSCARGSCVNGVCQCPSGWGGNNCNTKQCHPSCGVHGSCNNGVCVCQSGWGGDTCNTKLCDPDCVHGKCVNGKCVCNSGYTGPSCAAASCNPACVHGSCVNSKCQCNAGYEGASCNTKACVDRLSHKQCNLNKIYCNQIKDGGRYADYMKKNCCAFCKNVKCTNSGLKTETQCLGQLINCKPLGQWMDLHCCATCAKYLGKCIDTKLKNKIPDCSVYGSDLWALKTGTGYTGTEHHKKMLQLHCCHSIKNAKPKACVDSPNFPRCTWPKWLKNNCASDEYTKKNCCAACKKVLGK